MITRIHIAALAFGIFGLGAQLAPLEAHPVETAISAARLVVPQVSRQTYWNPLVLLFPRNAEWNCSQQPKGHWCKRR